MILGVALCKNRIPEARSLPFVILNNGMVWADEGGKEGRMREWIHCNSQTHLPAQFFATALAFLPQPIIQITVRDKLHGHTIRIEAHSCKETAR